MKWKLLYVLTWSGGLFFATFPAVIRGTFNFSLREGSTTDLIDLYTIPLMMAMALFLTDALYAYRLDQSIGRANSFVGLFMAEIAFLVSFALSLFGDTILSVIMFVCAWLSMTAMKLLTTPIIEQSRRPREARRALRN